MRLEPGKTQVRTVRFRSASSDGALIAARFARALAATDLRPGTLGDAAIFFVRTLRDPMPGRLSFREIDLTLPAFWETGVRDALTRLAADAARPAIAVPPESAQAVLFRDRSEMLVALARDWLSGSIRLRWWWRAILDEFGDRDALLRAWLDRPEYIPAAMHQLASSGLAIRFVQALTERSVVALLLAIARLAGLEQLVEPLLQCRDVAPGAVEPEGGAPIVAQHLTDAPWQMRAPAAVARDLAPARQALMGLALTLHELPAHVYADTFRQQLARWVSMLHQPLTDPPPRPQVLLRDRGRLALKTTEQRSAANEPASPAPPQTTRSDLDSAEHVSELKSPVIEPQMLRRSAQSDAEDSVATEWGGVFYLINVAMWLGLYPDFTEPQRRGLDLPIWDFLAMFALELGGDSVMTDPIWRLLARLSGRTDDEPPGHGFVPPDEWLRSVDWLKPISSFVPTVLQPQERWIEWLARYLRARIALAMDEPVERACELLLRCPARIILTEAHVDVHFALGDLPIQVRLAGLDRNPGWVPAAARFVAFHYQ